MSDNPVLPASGVPVEGKDIGSGVIRQFVGVRPVDGSAADSIGGLTETAPASDTASSGLNGRLQRIAQRITTLLAVFPATLDTNSGNKSASTLRTVIASDQGGLMNKCFSAAFTTLTRPANTTAYTARDSISNNATAGSVTALSATISDTNDAPIFISEIVVVTTDTGIAGKKLCCYLFNSDPTASSGVGGGDNAAFSQKKAGYVATFVGTMEQGFSDGCVGRLIPSMRDTNYTPAAGFVVTLPTSGAQTLYIQFVAEEAFTPSANSTTFIATAKGWQGRAT